MTTPATLSYTLPFRRGFDVPVGASIQYAGMSKWLYLSAVTGELTAHYDRQPNSYARDCGGMTGTVWIVTAVTDDASGECTMVTLDPAHAAG